MVGSAVQRLAPKHHEILTIDRTILDLRNSEATRDFLERESPQAIILAAARVGGILGNAKNQKSMLLENLQIQNSVIDAALKTGVQNFVFLGSSCIYPKFATQPILEKSLLTGSIEPTNEGYAIAKIAGLRLTKAIAEENNLNYFTLMPTNLFGPNDLFDSEKAHVPAALIRKFHEAATSDLEKVSLWGTGKPLREFMYVDDLADAIWYFLGLGNIGGELINIGTGHEISIREFSELISNVTNFHGRIEFDTSFPDGAPRKLLDSSKASRLGWHSKFDLRASLTSTYNWYVDAIAKGVVRGV